MFEIYKESKVIHLVQCDFLEIETKEDGYIGDACISLQTQIRELINKYNVQEVDEFDLNAVPSDSKKYNGRLNNYYYILTKN